ncbi:MAG TPA: DUF3025 domain-containing protein [Kofleriaceae bacterium]|nr:DUF3025 domain-containing protein [Kofleriaceae bacterium]
MLSGWEPDRLQHPRFARVADLVTRLTSERDWPEVATLNAAFAPELGSVGVRLVEAPKLKPALGSDGAIDIASLYEVRIVEAGEIPTRPRNAHDLLNALVWAAFPRTKLALTRELAAVQRVRAEGRATLPNARSPAHDKLAMFDEGALVRVRGTTWIFGHAVYEHAYAGVFDVRGAAVELDLEIDGLSTIDARARIDGALAAADLASLVRTGPGVPVD